MGWGRLGVWRVREFGISGECNVWRDKVRVVGVFEGGWGLKKVGVGNLGVRG